ncbi:MAG: N-acetyltransferase [Leptospirales bacterium]|jgi:putative acetyltransferase
MNLIIRNEQSGDYRVVEELTRDAFWNLYFPGCDEHYLVHVMRDHPDFIPEMAFVADLNGVIVGNIMFTKSHLVDEAGGRIDTITFGPVCVHPDHQGKGVGPALIRHSIEVARKSDVKAIAILGHPRNYVKYGFKSSRDYLVSDAEGRYPFGQLVLELEPGALGGEPAPRKLQISPLFEVDEARVAEFDRTFPRKEKAETPSQVEFSIAARAYLD